MPPLSVRLSSVMMVVQTEMTHNIKISILEIHKYKNIFAKIHGNMPNKGECGSWCHPTPAHLPLPLLNFVPSMYRKKKFTFTEIEIRQIEIQAIEICETEIRKSFTEILVR